MTVKKMIADMEADLRAARDYARLIFDRLAMTAHPIDADAKRALSRVADDMLARVAASNAAYDALFEEIHRDSRVLRLV